MFFRNEFRRKYINSTDLPIARTQSLQHLSSSKYHGANHQVICDPSGDRFYSMDKDTFHGVRQGIKVYPGKLGNGSSGVLIHIHEGSYSIIMRQAGTTLAIKRPLDAIAIRNIATEKSAYERCGKHPFILNYYGETTYEEQGTTESVLLLEYLESSSFEAFLAFLSVLEQHRDGYMKKLAERNVRVK